MTEFGRWLEESRTQGVELWAAIEKPQGRIVDFLLDHGVLVYPVNPKALDRVRDRFRMSQSKSDSFDAYVLAEFLRTDHAHLRALQPDCAQAQELKMLSRDHQRLMRQKTRLLNQIGITLKEYYPRPLEVFGDLESTIARDFLKAYPTPQALSKLNRRGWDHFAQRDHHLSEARSTELWEKLAKAQLSIPEHVIRAKAKLLLALVVQLEALLPEVESYSDEVERFFVSMPAAELVKTLPGGKCGTTVAKLWAELGDAIAGNPIATSSTKRLNSPSPNSVARAVCFFFDLPVTSTCDMPSTGFRLIRSGDVSGRTSTIGSSALKGTVILERSELLERSGLRLFL